MLENMESGRNTFDQETTDDHLKLKEELLKYLENLPRDPREKRTAWAKSHIDLIEQYGDDSIVSLLPEKIVTSSHFLNRSIRHLARCGIISKHDLKLVNLDESRELSNVNSGNRALGKKMKEFAKLLQKLAVAEDKTTAVDS
ncbi:MAG TPA: hypothetical protein VI819_05430 [Patescibacteria group bacterium]|nr:hypothetical protein [Patescibacteria group bacterium]